MMPAWIEFFQERAFLGNKLWQWLALLGILLLSFGVGKVVSFVLQRQGQRIGAAAHLRLLGMLLRSLSGPAGMLILAGGLYLAATVMNLTYVTQETTTDGEVVSVAHDLTGKWIDICKAVAVLAAGWFVYRLVDIVEFFLLRWTSRTETLLDDQLVPVIRKALRVFVVIVVLLFIAQNIFKWNVGALVAGLGIGGLAFALAAKDALSNLFGSVTIFADRPFQMGDRMVIAGHDGFVEEVGFRSTRLRTLMGHQVVIPNATVASETVENIGRRPYIKRVLNVTVTYDTPPEKVQRGVEIIREMLEARKEHFPEDLPPRVYFDDYNAASLNIVVYYWFTPPDWWEYLAFNHDFNMALLERFNAEGIEFAFPTQTLYLKQDSPVWADVRIGGELPRDGREPSK